MVIINTNVPISSTQHMEMAVKRGQKGERNKNVHADGTYRLNINAGIECLISQK